MPEPEVLHPVPSPIRNCTSAWYFNVVPFDWAPISRRLTNSTRLPPRHHDTPASISSPFIPIHAIHLNTAHTGTIELFLSLLLDVRSRQYHCILRVSALTSHRGNLTKLNLQSQSQSQTISAKHSALLQRYLLVPYMKV